MQTQHQVTTGGGPVPEDLGHVSVSPRPPQVRCLTGRTPGPGTRHEQSCDLRQGKDPERDQQGDKAPGVKPQEPRLPLPEPCPQGPAGDSLSAPARSCDDTCGVLSAREATRDAEFRVLSGARQTPTSRLAVGMQVRGRQHGVHQSGPESLSGRFWEQWEPSRHPKSPQPAQGQPCKLAFQKTAAPGLLCSLLCTGGLHSATQVTLGGTAGLRESCPCVVLTSESLVWRGALS